MINVFKFLRNAYLWHKIKNKNSVENKKNNIILHLFTLNINYDKSYLLSIIQFVFIIRF